MSKILTNITITQVIEFLEKCLSYEIGCNSRKNVNEGIFELKEIPGGLTIIPSTGPWICPLTRQAAHAYNPMKWLCRNTGDVSVPLRIRCRIGTVQTRKPFLPLLSPKLPREAPSSDQNTHGLLFSAELLA